MKTDARMHLVNFEIRNVSVIAEKRIYIPVADKRMIMIPLEKRQRRILQ